MKLKGINSWQIILISIVVLAFLIRIIRIGEVPPGLNRDEAAIGYTAYSLLLSGRDEHGITWPVSLRSFGDWKLPLYAYLTLPFVKIFDLTELAVRLPSVITGTLTVLICALIVWELFNNRKLALLAALILAINPWHVFFSRTASEANIAVGLTTVSFWLILESHKKKSLVIVSLFLLSLTLLTYHGNHIFTPLLVLGLVWKNKKLFIEKTGFVALAIFGLMAVIIYTQTLFSADKTKISGLFALNDPALVYGNVVENRLIYKNNLLARLIHNKATYWIENVSQNYFRSFSPEFLFIKGGGNKQHNLQDYGNLYLIEGPLLLIGLYFLFSQKHPYAKLLLWWILISPIGAALTKDAPHSARQFSIFPALTIVVIYGIYALVKTAKSWIKILLIAIIVIAYITSSALFFSKYFVTFPYKSYSYWGKAYKEMVLKLLKYKDDYQEVYVARPDYSPYIYYLFYQKSDPVRTQKELKYYPQTSEGFMHVKEFDGIKYQKLNWSEELLLPNRLYVDWVEGIPSGATQSAVIITKTELITLQNQNYVLDNVTLGTMITSRIIDQIIKPDGKPLLYFIDTRTETASPASL